MRRLLPCLALGLLAACGGRRAPEPEPPANETEELLALANRGISHLERYDEADTAKAVAFLAEAVRRAPQWRDARVNYAIALAATKRGDGLEAAVGEFAKVLEEDPTNPHALLGTALARRFQGRVEEGIPFLHRLLAVDPEEASVYFWLGAFEIERTEEDLEVAEKYLRRAIELAPDDATAMHALFTVLHRKGDGEGEEAKRLIQRSRDIEEANGFGSPALAKHRRRGDKEYGEGGKYAQTIRDLAPPAGACFGLVAQPGLGGPLDGAAPAVAVGDPDADGDDDLWIGGPGADGVFLRNDAGRFVDATKEAGLSGLRAAAALFADADEDGRADLWLVGSSLRVLGSGEKGFAEWPAERLSAGAAAGPFVSVSAGDVDMDGDVDAILCGPAPRFLSNRRDGSFEDWTERRRAGQPGAGAVVIASVTEDGLNDLLAFGPEGPPRLLRSGSLDPFAPDERLAALGPAVSGTFGDANGDALMDIVLVRPDGALALAAGGADGRYALDPTFPTRRVRANAAAVADFDLDGRPDILAVGPLVTLYRGLPRGGFSVEAVRVPEQQWRTAGILDLDGDTDLDVVLAAPGVAPIALRNETPRTQHVLRVRPKGVPDRVEGRTWSNARGLGADVEVKAGDMLARHVVLAGSGFPGQMTDTLHVGLGARARADFVRVRWTDGVLQSEFDIPAGPVREIVEANRKMASCPVLFAWTGSQHEYVTDTLGAGGLGFYVGPPLVYGPPDPTEVVRLPRLEAKDGRFDVRLVENMEEVAYLDEARLLVVDHPADLEVHPDERFAVEPPWPQDRLWAVGTRVFPTAASDDRGRDVRPLLLAEDRRTVDGFEKDRRFLGMAKPHALVLDFGDAVPAVGEGERLVLFLSGWIEYGYSKVTWASLQADVAQDPPVLEVPDGDGWKRAAGIGYPAGNPRTMTVDVTGVLAPGRGRCRIRTNLEVYWDRVFLAKDEAPGRLRVTELAPVATDLRERGYPREYSPDGKAPTLYDYAVCESWIPFRSMPGDYTRFGDVTPLVSRADDQFAIFGKGEEVALYFDAGGLPPLREGEARTFLVRLDGYCKDRDPYTGAWQGVEPLPFHAMSNYPPPAGEKAPDGPAHREYRARWNTRRVR